MDKKKILKWAGYIIVPFIFAGFGLLLGGGTGTSTVLRGLKYFPVDITAVITVSDNGRSTGRLRKCCL